MPSCQTYNSQQHLDRFQITDCFHWVRLSQISLPHALWWAVVRKLQQTGKKLCIMTPLAFLWSGNNKTALKWILLSQCCFLVHICCLFRLWVQSVRNSAGGELLGSSESATPRWSGCVLSMWPTSSLQTLWQNCWLPKTQVGRERLLSYDFRLGYLLCLEVSERPED